MFDVLLHSMHFCNAFYQKASNGTVHQSASNDAGHQSGSNDYSEPDPVVLNESERR